MVENQRVYNPWAESASPKPVEKQVVGRWLDELSGQTSGTNYKKLSHGLSDKFKDVKDMADQFPLTTAGLGIVGGVCLFGAARLGVANRLGIPIKNETEKVLVHLTRAQKVEPIFTSGKIGGKWGIFALEGHQVPEHNLARNVKTLVPGELSGVVPFRGEVLSQFHKPIPVGPFSLYRNLAGVRSSWLGSVDVQEGKFVANEIFENGVFRKATAGEISRFKRHQYMLDYGIDAEIWSVGAAAAFRHEIDKPAVYSIRSRIADTSKPQ